MEEDGSKFSCEGGDMFSQCWWLSSSYMHPETYDLKGLSHSMGNKFNKAEYTHEPVNWKVSVHYLQARIYFVSHRFAKFLVSMPS